MALFWKKSCSEVVQVCPEQEIDITKHIHIVFNHIYILFYCQKFTWKIVLKLMALLFRQMLTSLK